MPSSNVKANRSLLAFSETAVHSPEIFTSIPSCASDKEPVASSVVAGKSFPEELTVTSVMFESCVKP